MPVSQTFTNGDEVYVVDAEDIYDLNFLAGADRLTVWRGTTTAAMGDGNDVVTIRGGVLNADGGAGHDRFNFYAAATGFVLHGNDGDDKFFGYGHQVSGVIYGDADDDYFVNFSSRYGEVALHGGTGNDIYRHHAGTAATFIELADEGIDSVQVARGASYTLGANLERVTVSGFSGSDDTPGAITGNALDNTITAHNNPDRIHGLDGDDKLFGKGGDDVIYGGAGWDYLDGGPGIDQLYGGFGNDRLNGRAGADYMAGGTGDDIYYVDDVGDVLVESDTAGHDKVYVALADYTLPDNVNEAILLVDGGTLRANDGVFSTLRGNGTLIAGDAGSYMRGSGTFITGPGGDHIISDGNGDIIVFDADTGSDSVTLFGGDDVLDFSAIDGDPIEPGDQPLVVVSAFTGTPGEVMFFDSISDDGFEGTRVTIDVDGDGVFDISVFSWFGHVTAGDLIL